LDVPAQTQATVDATGADAPRQECDAAPLQTDPPDGIEKTPAAAIMPPPGARASKPQTTRTRLPLPLQNRKSPFLIAGKPSTDGRASDGKSALSTCDNIYGNPKKYRKK
jgi:hypothetical protein